MDSLLVNYASSDEEEREEQSQHTKPPSEPLVSKSEAEEQDFPSKSTSRPGGIYSSLPPPKSSLFNSLPPPKSQSFPNPKPQTIYVQQNEQIDDQILENSKPKVSSSSLFSSLPLPKSLTSASSSTTSKKVVQFRPPPMINPFSSGVNDDDEDEDEDEEDRQRKKSRASLSTSSAMSFLSSMPAPKNSASLGSLPSALGSGRRCIIESEARDPTESVTGSGKVVSSNVGLVNDQSDEMNYDNSSWALGSKSTENYSGIEPFHGENVASAAVSVMENDGVVNSNLGSSEVKSDELNYGYSGISGSESYYSHHIGGQSVSVGPEAVDYSYGNEDHTDYPNYAADYEYYSNNPQDENHGADTSIMTASSAFPEASGGFENALNVSGRRGRRDAPQDIVEVKQDELMKNRPREDQTNMTGLAFGPAYQSTSTKGKPSKLHKRKHQIGSLLFDVKQKEMEFAERRSKGYATKAQTQAKYGW